MAKTNMFAQGNSDRIRGMNDEELAHFIANEDMCLSACGSDKVCGGGCFEALLAWFQQPAETEGKE